MIGVLKFSKPALGQMYHCGNARQGCQTGHGTYYYAREQKRLTATMNGSGRKTPMARQMGTMW